jgi:hypothetical protein
VSARVPVLVTLLAVGGVVGAWRWLLAEPQPRPQDVGGTPLFPAPDHLDELKGIDFGGEFIGRVPKPRLEGLQWLVKAEGSGDRGLNLTAECASLQLGDPDAAWLDVFRLRQTAKCLGVFALGRGATPEPEWRRKLHACAVVQGRALVLFSTSTKTWLGWTKHHPLRDDLTMQAVEVWKNVPCNLVTSASLREVQRGAALELKMGRLTLSAIVEMKGGALLTVADVADSR